MRNDLSEVMKARLEKWRNNIQKVPSAEKVRGPMSKGDYLDSIQDIEDREAKQWKDHLDKNPQFRR